MACVDQAIGEIGWVEWSKSLTWPAQIIELADAPRETQEALKDDTRLDGDDHCLVMFFGHERFCCGVVKTRGFTTWAECAQKKRVPQHLRAAYAKAIADAEDGLTQQAINEADIKARKEALASAAGVNADLIGDDMKMECCATCNGDRGELIVCDNDDCPKAFHLACAGLSAIPTGVFVCSDCVARSKKGGGSGSCSLKAKGCGDEAGAAVAVAGGGGTGSKHSQEPAAKRVKSVDTNRCELSQQKEQTQHLPPSHHGEVQNQQGGPSQPLGHAIGSRLVTALQRVAASSKALARAEEDLRALQEDQHRKERELHSRLEAERQKRKRAELARDATNKACDERITAERSRREKAEIRRKAAEKALKAMEAQEDARAEARLAAERERDDALQKFESLRTAVEAATRAVR